MQSLPSTRLIEKGNTQSKITNCGNSLPAPKTHKNYLQESNAVRHKICSKAAINDFKDSLLVLSVFFVCACSSHYVYAFLVLGYKNSSQNPVQR